MRKLSDRRAGITALLAGCSMFLLAGAALADGNILPRSPTLFEGTLAPTQQGSDTYEMPSPVRAPGNAPNVLLIMTDDVGFGAVSTFGGPIPKPNLDRLAAQGLTYNRFHTTGICSPTRAALLTGRNHHAVGTGALTEMITPYPGYTGAIPPQAASIARILRDNGYNTAMFGKDHNVPMAHRSPAGPFDLWPTGRGFEYFYGFMFGDTDQFQPSLYLGTQPIDAVDRDEDYILDADLVDRTIEWIHTQKAAAPDKPFFIYKALGTAHAPHQVPAEWIAKFHGQFDHGWDEQRRRTLEQQIAQGVVPEGTELAPRPDSIPAWDALSDTEKKVYARFMEVYAAMLAHQDHQLGRLLDELERMGILDDTLVIYIEGDNGSAAEVGNFGSLNELPDIASSEYGRKYDLDWLADNLDVMGGPKTYQATPAGWSLAMNTPMPWVKQMASHLGGIRNGLVISWPDGMGEQGELRTQFHHVIDVMPTILEAAGVSAPGWVDGIEQLRVDGVSMLYSFTDGEAAPARNTQYFEMVANRAIYHDGWFANTTPRNLPWNISRAGPGTDTSTYEWELYNLEEDFSQSRNVAAEHPDQLRRLQEIFDREASENNVYPLQNDGAAYRSFASGSRSGAPRTEFIYWGPNIRIPMSTASPPIFWLPFQVEAEITIPDDGAEGVIYAAGSQFGGWSFYLQDGRPVAAAAHSPLPGGFFRIAADRALPPGSHRIVFDVNFADAGAEVRISANDQELVNGSVAGRPSGVGGGGETFDTGRDTNLPVSLDYKDEGVFTGQIDKVVVRIKRPVQ